jgi:hypothetical protein
MSNPRVMDETNELAHANRSFHHLLDVVSCCGIAYDCQRTHTFLSGICSRFFEGCFGSGVQDKIDTIFSQF